MQEEIRMDKYFSSFLLVFPMSVWHDRVMSKLVFRSGCDKCKGGCVSGGPMAHGRERKEMWKRRIILKSFPRHYNYTESLHACSENSSISNQHLPKKIEKRGRLSPTSKLIKLPVEIAAWIFDPLTSSHAVISSIICK